MNDVCIQKTEGQPDTIGEHEWVEKEVRVRLRHGVIRYTWQCRHCLQTKVEERAQFPPRGLPR
jgi:hypothetical protein